MIEHSLKQLRQRYSEHILEIIRLMLKYDEHLRPSFTELSKLVLTSTENTIESPKGPHKRDKKTEQAAIKLNESSLSQEKGKKVNKVNSMRELIKDASSKRQMHPLVGGSMTDTNGMSSKILHRKPTDMSIQPSRAIEDSQANLMT